MIHTLLGRSVGAGEWAVRSLALLVVGLWGLIGGFFLLSSQQADYLSLAAVAIHWLLWWQVLRGAWIMCRDEEQNDWLLAGAVLWWLVLVGFQLLCLAYWLEPHNAASGTPWLQF